MRLDACLLGDLILSVDGERVYNQGNVSMLMGLNTDGTYDYNMTLSENRAGAVADYCIAKNGNLASIISTKGYSYDNPVYNEDGSVDMAASRRVTFRFVLTTAG